ncbi:hypothetical protein GPX89_39795 [Nocardia sp. ET3-3]|uniref:DUF8020 domain-containing protein n=1 Tax=Nocardia terrae TaxID=2675851 RepID=A0A7K1VBA4_9NOCA|nr:hypothetical protein [Nocardia terrae]MVU83368.1 hypothetical protein [Nocardia terrae]
MQFRKFAAASMLTIAATVMATATAHGEAQVPLTVGGQDHGLTYTSTLSEDHQGVVTQLSEGRFTLSEDRSTVSVEAADGTVVEQIPTDYELNGYPVHLRAEVAEDGSSLTVWPRESNGPISTSTYNDGVQQIAQAQLKDIGVIGCIAGGAVGAALFGAIGTVLGLIALILGSIPGLFIGLVAGAVIGCVVGFFVI